MLRYRQVARALLALIALALQCHHAVAQTTSQPPVPNPLRRLLPTSADLPGFQQVLDTPYVLQGAATFPDLRGVLRGFGAGTEEVLVFELFSVPDGALAGVQP